MSRRMGLLGGKSRVPIGTVWYFTTSDTFVVPETGTYSIVAVGGGGGGKPNMAQAGGKDTAKVEEAMSKAKELLKTV